MTYRQAKVQIYNTTHFTTEQAGMTAESRANEEEARVLLLMVGVLVTIRSVMRSSSVFVGPAFPDTACRSQAAGQTYSATKRCPVGGQHGERHP